jgi:hypothetical protein
VPARAAAPLNDYRQTWVLATDRRSDAEGRVQAMEHGVGAGQQRARFAAQQRAGRRILTGPQAECDVQARLLEQGEVGDR